MNRRPPSTEPSHWFHRLTLGGGSRTIVVIPPAGGGAAAFRPWASLADSATDVQVVVAPGRDHRIGEEPFHHVGPVADTIASGLEGLPHPWVLFGHSAGALVAREVAARVPEHHLAHVVVAGAAPPDCGGPNLALASDEELIDALRAWGGTPEAVLADASMTELFLPCLRADLAVAQSCRVPQADDLVVDVPITALVGSDDRFVHREQATGWQRWTTSSFDLHTVAGGHFFPTTHASEVVPIVTACFAGSGDGHG